MVEMSEFELQAEVAMFFKSGGDVRGLPATAGMLEITSLSHSLATIRSKHNQHSVAAAATLDFRRRLCRADWSFAHDRDSGITYQMMELLLSAVLEALRRK